LTAAEDTCTLLTARILSSRAEIKGYISTKPIQRLLNDAAEMAGTPGDEDGFDQLLNSVRAKA
jgi:hypothetical protein